MEFNEVTLSNWMDFKMKVKSSLFMKLSKAIPSFYDHIWYFYFSPICTNFSIHRLILLTAILLKIRDLFQKVVHCACDNWPIFISLWKIPTEKILYHRHYPSNFNIKDWLVLNISLTIHCDKICLKLTIFGLQNFLVSNNTIRAKHMHHLNELKTLSWSFTNKPLT